MTDDLTLPNTATLVAIRLPAPFEVEERVALEALLNLYRLRYLFRWHSRGAMVMNGDGDEAYAAPGDLIVVESPSQLAVYTRSFDA